MVNFAVCRVFCLRNRKSSTMIGRVQAIFPVTAGIGGCSSVPPNFGPGLATAEFCEQALGRELHGRVTRSGLNPLK